MIESKKIVVRYKEQVLTETKEKSGEKGLEMGGQKGPLLKEVGQHPR